MKIHFVATRKNADPTERELYELDLMLRVLGFDRAFMDLGLQTVATVTPAHHDIRFTDEYLERIDYDTEADIVALSGKTSCITRTYQVADEFRRRGKTVVLGGIHASLRPDEALQHCDIVVDGEAEELWPRVLADIEQGKAKQLYKADGFPEMSNIPSVSWRGMDPSRYFYQQLQTTRGCPFMCRFCSVPDISGQAFRCKPEANIVQEIRDIPLGRGPIQRSRPLYVVDDNFISKPAYTKRLLEELVKMRRAGDLPDWSAETTLNVARDDQMLDLFRDAGCTVLIIGFESVTEATLQDMDKSVNFCMTYQEAVDAIRARGIKTVGNFIVGFDTDDLRVFRDTLEFIDRYNIMYPFFSILTPMPGTGLFDDTKAEGRLFHERWDLYDTRHVVFQPKQMTPDQLMDGYVWIYEQAYGPDAVLSRLEDWWRNNPIEGAPMSERLFMAAKVTAQIRERDIPNRRFLKDVLKLYLNKNLRAETGSMLYMLDAHHFANFLGRFNSRNKEANYRLFADPEAAMATSKRLSMQWDKVEKKRKKRAKLAVVA
ncbi:MAG: radical SAM protein [Deltaproteobacteria bacterium]